MITQRDRNRPKGARIYLPPGTEEWIIRDSGRPDQRTGVFGRNNQEAAEQALAEYIQGRAPEKIEFNRPKEPRQIPVGLILARYAQDMREQMAAPDRLDNALLQLSPFWGDLTCDKVIGSYCRAYEKERGKPRPVPFRGGKKTRLMKAASPTVRRELGVLQAALVHGYKEGLIDREMKVTLPQHGTPRERWLMRSEVARLIWVARRSRNPHLARFILIGVYTGTRPSAILALTFTTSLSNGYVDLERGVLYRKGKAERETKKRRGECKLPTKLPGHMRRWARIAEREGTNHLVQYNGQPIKSIETALERACKKLGIPRVTPHVMKHTAVTWAFQKGMSPGDAADFFSTTADTLQRVYRQHHSEFQQKQAEIMNRRS